MAAEGGLSTLHLLSLPSAVNRVMRLFLRSKQIPYADIQKSLEGMPTESRLTNEELDELLEILVQREWLVRIEENQQISYGINLRQAVASASAKADDPSPRKASSDRWAKAGMDSAGAPDQRASDIHADITGGKRPPVTDSEKSDETTGEPKRDSKKKLKADDLWDILD